MRGSGILGDIPPGAGARHGNALLLSWYCAGPGDGGTGFLLQQPGPAEATHCGAEGGFAYRNCSSSQAVGGGCPSSMLQASIV